MTAALRASPCPRCHTSCPAGNASPRALDGRTGATRCLHFFYRHLRTLATHANPHVNSTSQFSRRRPWFLAETLALWRASGPHRLEYPIPPLRTAKEKQNTGWVVTCHLVRDNYATLAPPSLSLYVHLCSDPPLLLRPFLVPAIIPVARRR
jgi:hypothetical protein